MGGHINLAFVEQFEAEEQANITSDEDVRERRRFDVREGLVDEEGAQVSLFEYPFLPLEHRRSARILKTNWGRRDGSGVGERFAICAECGRHRPSGDERAKKWDEDHARYCPGTCEDLVFAYEFRTDALVASLPPLPGVSGYDERLLVTAAEALLLGASTFLETEAFEISGFPRKTGETEPGQVVLYETVPGGAGYLEELARSLPAAARAAYDRIFGHVCAKACYRCLKRFGNQRWHGLLDKELVRDLLFHLGLEASVAPSTVLVGEAKNSLNRQVTERINERQGGAYPKGHIEEVLLEALHRHDTLPSPERDHEIYSDSGALVTVPDFAWPEVRLAVFCDGYQYHGDRETLELDASKRNFLQARGWAVLTYWGRQILNHPERCAEQVVELVRQRQEAEEERTIPAPRATPGKSLARAAEEPAPYQ
jgi:hypothetical protein